jgi:hypothetical protein
MAKNFKKGQKNTKSPSSEKIIAKPVEKKVVSETISKPSATLQKFLQYRAAHQWIIFIFAFLLYSNTSYRKKYVHQKGSERNGRNLGQRYLCRLFWR